MTYGARPIATIALLTSLSACLGCSATVPQIPPKTDLSPYEGFVLSAGWWNVRFRIRWPKGVDPSWYMDAYIAHAIIAPVLSRHKEDISLWRFHRRAARDATGHQFSFIFYSTAPTARKIFESIRNSENLGRMSRTGEIVQVDYDDPRLVTHPDRADTSDPKWSPFLRRAWPYYIMGVSQLWLELIRQNAEELLKKERPVTLEQVKTFYERVDQSVTRIWREEGRHAFLHHLNALFGYQPVVVYERRFLEF